MSDAFEANKQVYGFYTMKEGETLVLRNRFVAQEGLTVKAPANGGACVGVAQLDADTTGQSVGVQYGGVALVECSASIAVDAEVETEVTGLAVTYSAGIKLGQALSAGDAGELIAVRLY